MPPSLSVLIGNLLAKDRSARPASAAIGAAALTAMQEKPASLVPMALPAAPQREENDLWATLTETAEQQALPKCHILSGPAPTQSP